MIKYKIAPETFIEYEGKIVDKRVGSEDKESYVELKDCLTLNPEGKIVAIEKMKRLTDSFIEAGVSWNMHIRIIILVKLQSSTCFPGFCFSTSAALI